MEKSEVEAHSCLTGALCECFHYEGDSNVQDAELLEAAAQFLRQHNDITLLDIAYHGCVSNYADEEPQNTVRLYYEAK